MDNPDGAVRFKTDPGRVFSVDHAGLSAVLDCLVDASPGSLSVVQLLKIMGSDVTREAMAAMFDGLHRNAAVEFTSHPFGCVKKGLRTPICIAARLDPRPWKDC